MELGLWIATSLLQSLVFNPKSAIRNPQLTIAVNQFRILTFTHLSPCALERFVARNIMMIRDRYGLLRETQNLSAQFSFY